MIENICIFTSKVKYLKYFHDVLVFLSFDFTSENLKCYFCLFPVGKNLRIQCFDEIEVYLRG